MQRPTYIVPSTRDTIWCLFCTLFILLSNTASAQDFVSDYKAAINDNTQAMYALGKHYENGIEVNQNNHEALKWYLKAARKGHTKAMCQAGYFYTEGKGVATNYDKALLWYKKAAVKNNKNACYAMGLIYRDGKGVPKDDQQALTWFLKAAKKQLPEAMTAAAMLYEKGGDSLEINLTKAIEWYKRAAHRDYASADYRLGLLYRTTTQDTIRSDKKALQHFSKAATKGNAAAMYEIALLHLEDNPNEGVKWLQQSAGHGHTIAMRHLAMLYSKGFDTIAKDMWLSYTWYKKAAEKHDIEAMYQLSRIYYNGLGVTPNEEAAQKWLKSAANRGHQEALIALNQHSLSANQK